MRINKENIENMTVKLLKLDELAFLLSPNIRIDKKIQGIFEFRIHCL